ncbi:helix-turn-helix domain-containing protein [Roseateles sp. P5_E11]
MHAFSSHARGVTGHNPGIQRETRAADSPSAARFITHIDRVSYTAATQDLVRPDGSWDLVFRQTRSGLMVLQTGQTDRIVELGSEAGDSYLSIAFRPEIYMPARPGQRMMNQGHVHGFAGRRDFLIGDERLELPSFENAEQLVMQLARRGLIEVDLLVQRAAAGGWERVDDRSLQRHSSHVTGMSPKKLQQILRADAAAGLLQQGQRPADVAAELGYTDQAHLTHSLRRILGLTPGQLQPRAPNLP